MSTRIFIFLFTSALFHLGLFIGLDEQVMIAENLTAQGSSSLLLDISASDEITPEPLSKPESKTQVSNKPAAKQPGSLDKQKHKDKTDTVVEQQQALTDHHHSENTPETNEPNFSQVAAILETEFSKHFYYPKVAQRRQWQGQVLVGFIIMSDGHIENVRVNKSSGYRVLDNAAIDAVEKIDGKNELTLALAGNSIEQILPVTYKLLAN